MRVQVQLDGVEIAQTAEACNGHQRIDRPKNQTKTPRTVRVLSKASPQGDKTAGEVKNVMSGRKHEMEHFMSKESHHIYIDHDRAAHHDIVFCHHSLIRFS